MRSVPGTRCTLIVPATSQPSYPSAAGSRCEKECGRTGGRTAGCSFLSLRCSIQLGTPAASALRRTPP